VANSSIGRLLVIGGTGFIGSEVAREALETGMSVAVLARHAPSDWRRPWLPMADYFVGPADDPALLSRALTGVDSVVYALGSAPPSTPNPVSADSVAPTTATLISVLDALRDRPGVGLTYISSGGTVYGDVRTLPADEDTVCSPISDYGAGKLRAEQYVRRYSVNHAIPIRILRVANAYGPLQTAADGQGIIAALLEAALTDGHVTIFGDGHAIRDYIHVADVAKAVTQLVPRLDQPQIVNVGTGSGRSLRQVLEAVQQLTGSDFRVSWRAKRTSDVEAIVLDPSRLMQSVDWEPRGFETGISETWQQLLYWQTGANEDESA
jgi:UDP-glucose 4-epimerase